ncbi:MAG: hypothetical protein A3E82_06960 [Gammaproteobacteria bacterium RIFCSPHIGHO2_12_FULL_38_11]|nr:MAG: hypothetical protein A3E82_06960 [Gammaproteobacteria bacterium RIFCSPHIGHO2_12_FULL_38_11]
MRTSITHKELLGTVHHDLKARYREFFESKLATSLLQQLNYFLSVEKITASIINLINKNKTSLLETMTHNSKIIDELREPYFGSLYKANELPSPEQVLKDMLLILNNKKSDPNIVMQIHCIFSYRIYNTLGIKIELSKSESLKNTLLPDSLFNSTNRKRVEKEAKPTNQLGFAQNPVFSKMIGQSEKIHFRAIDRFQPQNSSNFFKAAAEKNSPVICGASGHTSSLLLGASLYGNLSSTEELMEYSLACFAFLAAGGNHSFHEVMVVANTIGVHYEAGKYSNSIPLSVKTTEVYQNFCAQFPEFLDDGAQQTLKIA